jgi:asparaginyl-tRNA synthetase
MLSDAQQRHGSDLFQFPITEWGHALQTEHEKFLCDALNSAVFVTDYPAQCKPFYMRSNSEDNTDDDDGRETVACMDLLMPAIGELVGGSMREERFDRLQGRMKQMLVADEKTDYDELQWYLDLRRFGSAYHGGFGIGFDRLLMLLTSVPNIRDVVSVARYKSKCVS